MDRPATYQLRPVALQAIQYRPDIPNCAAVADFLGDREGGCVWGDTPHEDEYWADDLIEPGDWIIRWGPGDFLYVDADQFAAQYIEVVSETETREGVA